ncbi:hypothetical protein T265_12644, partial [Opisthorchis viverrini]
ENQPLLLYAYFETFSVTQVESHVVTKQFRVVEIEETYSDSDMRCNSVSSESGDDSDYLGKYNRAVIRRQAEDTLDDAVDNFVRRNADQGFAATNHSGTQINLWGQVPGLNWDVRSQNSANIYGSYYPTPQPTYIQMPYQAPSTGLENAVTHQQLTAIAGHLTQSFVPSSCLDVLPFVTQCIDQTRHMTVAEVRESLKQLSEKIRQPDVNRLGSRPLLAISQGEGDLKAQLDHIYSHLLEYTMRDPELSMPISQAKMGKVLSAEFDEDEYSFLLTVQLEKPGAPKRRKPLRERIREQSAPRKSPDMEDTKPVKETRPTTAKSEQATASKQPYQKEYVQSERKPSPKKEDKEERTEAEPPKQKAPEPYFVTEEVEYSPTLKPYPNFNAPDDCERLRKAMKGIGTDEKTIIEIMGARTASQRTQIVLQFKTMYGKDLIKEFSSELSGRFYDCVEALCYSPAEFDARQLRKAVKGMGTDESALIEILCSRTNDQIRQIKEAYTKVNPGRDLEKDVISDTSGNFKRIMVSLLQANRDESLTFDRNAARRDAEDLYEAGEKNLGTDESKFNMLLASKSFAYLRAVFVEYANVSKSDIETSIKKEMSGDLRKTMLAIVQCIQNKQSYFAKELMKSMKGLGTKDETLIRIIVSRCEMDMGKIKEEFQKESGKTLESWISRSIQLYWRVPRDTHRVSHTRLGVGTCGDLFRRNGNAFAFPAKHCCLVVRLLSQRLWLRTLIVLLSRCGHPGSIPAHVQP